MAIWNSLNVTGCYIIISGKWEMHSSSKHFSKTINWCKWASSGNIISKGRPDKNTSRGTYKSSAYTLSNFRSIWSEDDRIYQ